MNFLTFEESSDYPVVFLVPTIHQAKIEDAYLTRYPINKKDVMCVDLHYSKTKKNTPVAEIKSFLREELIPFISSYNPEYLMVADGSYFKVLTGAKKIDSNLGYVLDVLPEFNLPKVKAIYIPNYRAIFYHPEEVNNKIAMAMFALNSHRVGLYSDPGHAIIKSSYYPKTIKDIQDSLDALLEKNVPLTVDIEGFSLNPVHAGIGTIAFAWNQHEGIAFAVDYKELDEPEDGFYGENVINHPVRKLLIDFFQSYKQKFIYHNIAYDGTVLIYQLFMDDITDTPGLLHGLDVFCDNFEDTKLITYLATNSCAGNKLSLKDQAQEFAGNYAQEDIKDIRKIPLKELLEYNLVDALSTWYVHDKHWNQMVVDNQEDLYQTYYKHWTKDIIQMQLTGLPINLARVHEVKTILEADQTEALNRIHSSPLVQEFTYQLNQDWVIAKNATLKKKVVTLADAKETFNPGSPLQLQKLLYEQIGLPVLELTDSKQPATGRSALKNLKNHTNDQQVLDLLDAILDLKAVDKILSAFIPAFLEAVPGKDGWHYLIGSYNLGGTVSGRLSSSKPNMQQIPSGGKYGKLIKSCFQAPEGWILVGLDFDSLEDKISALTTKDKNKLKVYIDGYNGHCLRAYSYFPEAMPDIDPNSVESINSIEQLYPDERQESKAPTFALTYKGTYITLMRNLNWSEEKAKLVEARYHELYSESTEWVNQKLDQASKDGYITTAFGLRVRTPLLAQVVRGNSKTPYEAEAEGRTAGNALGQGWCALNSRACSEFLSKVRTSGFKYLIRPAAQIHDASYYIIKDDLNVLQYTNTHLVKAVQWQDDPEIYHDIVKLSGSLSIFYPAWDSELVIPNNASNEEILDLVDTFINKL